MRYTFVLTEDECRGLEDVLLAADTSEEIVQDRQPIIDKMLRLINGYKIADALYEDIAAAEEVIHRSNIQLVELGGLRQQDGQGPGYLNLPPINPRQT